MKFVREILLNEITIIFVSKQTFFASNGNLITCFWPTLCNQGTTTPFG